MSDKSLGVSVVVQETVAPRPVAPRAPMQMPKPRAVGSASSLTSAMPRQIGQRSLPSSPVAHSIDRLPPQAPPRAVTIGEANAAVFDQARKSMCELHFEAMARARKLLREARNTAESKDIEAELDQVFTELDIAHQNDSRMRPPIELLRELGSSPAELIQLASAYDVCRALKLEPRELKTRRLANLRDVTVKKAKKPTKCWKLRGKKVNVRIVYKEGEEFGDNPFLELLDDSYSGSVQVTPDQPEVSVMGKGMYSQMAREGNRWIHRPITLDGAVLSYPTTTIGDCRFASVPDELVLLTEIELSRAVLALAIELPDPDVPQPFVLLFFKVSRSEVQVVERSFAKTFFADPNLKDIAPPHKV